MHICIRVLSGSDSDDDKEKTINLEVTQKDEIAVIKRKIQQVEPSLPTYKQLLLFTGQQLEDEYLLEQYGIEDGSVLFLVIKPTGMVITIKMDISGSSPFSMDVESNSTIADVKSYIDRVRPDIGKRSPNYDLYLNANPLKESLTLKDCGVESQSTLQLSKSLQLQIRMMEGPSNTISLSALSADTVDTITRRIVQTQRLPNKSSIKYHMKFMGKELAAVATLSDCKVQDGSVLELHVLKQSSDINEELRIDRLRGQVNEVKGIMQQNIDRVYQCGDRILQEDIEPVELGARDREFKPLQRRILKRSRITKHCIVTAFCFPCVLIAECYHRRQRRNECRGYAKLPGDVIKTTTAEQMVASSTPIVSSRDLSVADSLRSPAIITSYAIDVRLPSGNSITLQASSRDTVQTVKSKIEKVKPAYPASHQRLVEPGHCDDLLDGEVVQYQRLTNVHLVLKGKLVSVHVKKQDGLPGFLTLYLEYFDTVRSIKEGINLDKNMRVAQSQQQLFLEENLLEDSLTLSQCGIEDGCQISVKVLAPSCQQLMNELLTDSVACRYDRFGIQLGLSPDTIECITMNHRDVYRCLINVINHWVRNNQVSWSAVASALDQIDCRNMAETIRIKYSVSN